MYTLYSSPGSCSLAVHAVLHELGVPFEVKKISLAKGENRAPEFLKLNPRGSVPVLVDGGHVIREGGAILIYLLDKHQSVLLPSTGTTRGTALEWLMFCNATLHPQFGRLFGLKKVEDQHVADYVKKETIERLNTLWQEVEERLQKNVYLAGDDCTVGDILLTVIANWSANFPEIKLGANTKKLLAKVIARPAFQRALEAEEVQYKAAA